MQLSVNIVYLICIYYWDVFWICAPRFFSFDPYQVKRLRTPESPFTWVLESPFTWVSLNRFIGWCGNWLLVWRIWKIVHDVLAKTVPFWFASTRWADRGPFRIVIQHHWCYMGFVLLLRVIMFGNFGFPVFFSMIYFFSAPNFLAHLASTFRLKSMNPWKYLI